MTIDWNIQILDTYKEQSTYKIVRAAPAFCIVYITCSSWEEALRIRTLVTEEINAQS